MIMKEEEFGRLRWGKGTKIEVSDENGKYSFTAEVIGVSFGRNSVLIKDHSRELISYKRIIRQVEK